MTQTLQDVARDLCAFAKAHPVNIRERVAAGLGPPLGHRRDLTHGGEPVRVLLTEERIGRFWGRHLSVMGLAGPLPERVEAEIVAAFLGPGGLLEMPSVLPNCRQYIALTPAPEGAA